MSWLFGEEIPADVKARLEAAGQARLDRAHAARPGTGPEEETCGSCRHLCARAFARVYYKCGLMEARWTGGRATDVRKKDAACRFWEAIAE